MRYDVKFLYMVRHLTEVLNLPTHLKWVQSGMSRHAQSYAKWWLNSISRMSWAIKLVFTCVGGSKEVANSFSHFKWVWSGMLKVMELAGLSCEFDFLRVVTRHIWIHIYKWFSPFLWVWSGTTGHAILNWPMILMYYIWLDTDRKSKLIHLFQAVYSLFVSLGPKILSANQIARFFSIKYVQNGLIFWLHLLYNISALWSKPTE